MLLFHQRGHKQNHGNHVYTQQKTKKKLPKKKKKQQKPVPTQLLMFTPFPQVFFLICGTVYYFTLYGMLLSVFLFFFYYYFHPTNVVTSLSAIFKVFKFLFYILNITCIAIIATLTIKFIFLSFEYFDQSDFDLSFESTYTLNVCCQIKFKKQAQ
ncbi:hypothetical protein RFI_23518 [Reticulomyxa filosa]|uniref:Uncharacterized protein n=1 Tax=Reticulomyxa filosa TaxID=46433 RepID=X6MJ04_RETFI|nr:hypothetical protein RFI_23518 [Reticulomyxa filosa]|eukprot:ETO13849.1 hypothetical protein RFI_23518 [Reticulomyxa filosa]